MELQINRVQINHSQPVPGPRGYLVLGGVPGAWSQGRVGVNCYYLVRGVYLVPGGMYLVPGVPAQVPPLWTESRTPVKI